jgi:hypothetical protein
MEFEKRGGRKLKNLNVAIAPKRKRKSRRGGKRNARAIKMKKLAINPDNLTDVLTND